MSEVLPVAEQMLTQHRALRPFGSTLSAAGQIVQVGGFRDGDEPDDATLIAEFEDSFRDGARRGELRATALVYTVSQVVPGESEAQHGVAIRLDHRDDYSLVVTFPYHFSDTGDLVILDPSAVEGAHNVFEG